MNFSDKYEQHKLLSITSADDITSVDLLSEFSDDHIPCANVNINNIDVDLFWCGSVVIGACEFADESPAAKRKVFLSLRSEIETSINIMFDKGNTELNECLVSDLFAYEQVMKYIRNQGPSSSIWTEVVGYFEYEDVSPIDTKTMTISI